MSDQKPVALLPCPLCGGDALRNGRGGIAGGVRCAGRKHYVQVYGRMQDDADATWNARTPPASEPVPEVAELIGYLNWYAYNVTPEAKAIPHQKFLEAAALLTAQAVMLEETRAELKHYAETFCEGIGECVGDFCGKCPEDQCSGCRAYALYAKLEASHVG